MDLRSHSNQAIRSVYQAFKKGEGAWVGCAWQTQFGDRQLDLCGLRSEQVSLLVEATSGIESFQWNAACEWLKQVEKDALDAERFAKACVIAAAEGNFTSAIRWIELAVDIEQKYRSPRIWSELAFLIRSLASQTPSHADSY